MWHDHRTVHNGTTHNHPPELPTGLSFSLVRDFDQRKFPLDPSRSRSTVSTPRREAVAVGSFNPDLPGQYTLHVEAAGNDQRIFSLTQGSFLSGFGHLAFYLVLASVLGLVGVVLVIVGIVFLATGSGPGPAPRPV